RKEGSPQRAPCDLCAAHSLRRYCPSRWPGYREPPPRASAVARMGSSRADNRKQKRAGRSYVFVDGSSGDNRADNAPADARFVERRILALRLEFVRIQHPRQIHIDDDHIGGRTAL